MVGVSWADLVVSDLAAAILASTASSAVMAALVAGSFQWVIHRSNRRLAERAADRDDKEHDVTERDSEVRAALALAAETRETYGALLGQLRAQSDSQSKALVGLNATIITLNETIRLLEQSSSVDRATLTELRAELAERTRERDDLERDHTNALADITAKESQLANLGQELLAWQSGQRSLPTPGADGPHAV